MAGPDALTGKIAKLTRRLRVTWVVVAILLFGEIATLLEASNTRNRVQGLSVQVAEARSGTLNVGKVRTRQIEVLDDKDMASIYVSGSKGRIELLTELNAPSVTLSGRGVGSIGVAIYDGSGLSSNLHAGYLRLGGMFAEPAIPSVLLSVLDGSSIEVADKQGFRTIVGESDVQFPRTGQSTHTSAATVYMFNKDGKEVWHAPAAY